MILAFFDLMRRWGADPDPDGALRMVAGCMAEGPEISLEEVIRVRSAFQRGQWEMSRLPVSDGDLSMVPDTVTALALVETSVTDAGIPHLLRLIGPKRLNLADTHITDEGLVALGSLQTLEWVCVSRTRVTATGVAQLKANRHGVK